MVFERVDRVVRRADHLDIIVLHQTAGMELGRLEQSRTMVVNLAGRRGVQQLRHAEGGLQFEVRPVVERVAHRIGHRLGPLLELLPVGGILARAVLLIDAVGTHGAPLVVVALEPYLRQVVETVVLGDIRGNQVAMIVDDRHLGRMVVVKALGRGGLQQEVVVVKLFHVLYYSGLKFARFGRGFAKRPFHNVKLRTFRHSRYEKLPNKVDYLPIWLTNIRKNRKFA